MTSHYATPLNAFNRPVRVAYPVSTENRAAACVRYAKAHWQKIFVAILAGIFAGFLTAAVSSRVEVPLSETVYAAAPISAANPAGHVAIETGNINQDTAAEVSRLRAQNQELQALVDTLRKHPQHSRTHRARVRRHGRGQAG